MGYLIYSAVFVGLAVSSEILYHVYKKLKRKYKHFSKVLWFSDTCPICNEPMQKKRSKECCRKGLEEMASWLSSARYSMDVCTYLFTCDRLSRVIKEAKARGVNVRIITDSHMAFATHSVIPEMDSIGIPIRWKEVHGAMHHKFCIIDSAERVQELGIKESCEGVVMCGSLNWTMQGWGGNWENVIITTHTQMIKHFHHCFSRLWESFTPFVTKQTTIEE